MGKFKEIKEYQIAQEKGQKASLTLLDKAERTGFYYKGYLYYFNPKFFKLKVRKADIKLLKE